MLFLLFQLGRDRYALEARSVVEVTPLLDLKRVPGAPKGVAGLFEYRGQPVPAVDLAALTLDQPAREFFSTRIIIVNCPDQQGATRLLGLIAERATQTLRADPRQFLSTGMKGAEERGLGPVFTDAEGMIQLLHPQNLLSEPMRHILFTPPPALGAPAQPTRS